MNQQSKIRTSVLLLVVGIMVSGCAEKAIKPADVEFDKYVTSVENKQQTQSVKRYRGRQESVGIPKNALWLGHARTAYFKSGDARVLIRVLAAPHPVVFKMDSTDKPVVFAPSSAVILKDYFDSFAIQSNWVYRVDNGVIIFEDWETRTIELASIIGTTAALLRSSSGAGLETQQNDLIIETDPYAEIESIVTEILKVKEQNLATQGEEDESSAREAVFSVSKAANTLFISARPNQVRKVVNAIAVFNKNTSKRAIFDVTVYDVILTGNKERSLNFDLLRSTTNWATKITGDTLSIGKAPVGGTASGLSLDNLMLQWMQTQGEVSGRIQRRFEVLNNQTATFLDTTEFEFVQSVTTPPPVDGVAQPSTAVLGTHRLGRTFNLFATITGSRVNVRMNINERQNAATGRIVTVGGDKFELLDILNNDRVISLSLDDGETRILTYFQSNDTTRENTKALTSNKTKNNSKTTESVIVISAVIVD